MAVNCIERAVNGRAGGAAGLWISRHGPQGDLAGGCSGRGATATTATPSCRVGKDGVSMSDSRGLSVYQVYGNVQLVSKQYVQLVRDNRSTGMHACSAGPEDWTSGQALRDDCIVDGASKFRSGQPEAGR